MNRLEFFIVIVIVITIGSSITWSVFQYKECKKEGFSTFYCVQHIL